MSRTIPQKKKPEQLDLFKQPDLSSLSKNGAPGFHDPAFACNKTLPIHRWVPWIAGFSSEFVKNALDRCSKEQGIVLDPFAGVGTTLVESILAGQNGIGFEINPYAALACHVKGNAYCLDNLKLYKEIGRFDNFYDQAIASGYDPRSSPPQGFKSRVAFYSPKVLNKVLIVQDFIETLKERSIRDVFRLAFASTMVRYSNYSYEPSLGRRASSGKPDILDFAVGKAVLDKLAEMLEDINWFQLHRPKGEPTVTVIGKSFFECRDHLAPESVDMIVTSPPYLNNYHYNRNTRPQLYWLGFTSSPQDLRHLEETNFGKFWQTVREQARLELIPELRKTSIANTLDELRKLNLEKGIYGGNGWANYAAAYFNDCYAFAQAMSYVLKPGASALVVIGNSILQGVFIPTDQYLAQIAELVGLELVNIEIPRATRVGNSIIKSNVRVAKAQDSHQLYEAVIDLRKR